MTRLRIACAALAACAWIVGASVVQAQQVSVTHLHAFKHESGASQTVGSVHLGRDGKLHGLAEGLVWEMAVDGSGYTTYALPDGIMTHQYGLPNMATSTVADQNGNIYGATYIGGGTSMGLMFRFDESGTASEVLAPTQVDRPAKISQATGNMAVDAAGNVYVLDRGSSVGTGLREGAIKRLSADQSAFTVVHQMTPETGSNAAVVIVGSDGWLYGVAGQGETTMWARFSVCGPMGRTSRCCIISPPSRGSLPNTGLSFLTMAAHAMRQAWRKAAPGWSAALRCRGRMTMARYTASARTAPVSRSCMASMMRPARMARLQRAGW